MGTFPIINQESLSVLQEKDIEYDYDVEYLCINSSDRDITAYPKVNQYRIDFDCTFRNICSIEVVSASVANQNTPLSNPYFILKVDGMDHLNFSNKNMNKGFALLYLKPTTGAHVFPELGVLQRNVRVYKTPLASMSSLSVQILKPDGTLFDFGEANGDITTAYSNSFVFKITTASKNKNRYVEHRNVF
jgi:hypothetical protein